MANFRRGADTLEEASHYASFQKTNFLKIEDGKAAIVRFLTDAAVGIVTDGILESCGHKDEEHTDDCVGAWITVDMHNNIPTKPKPSDWKSDKNWPGTMMAVCRHDQAFRGQFDDCYICDVMRKQNDKIKKPTARAWALACLREEVRGDGSEDMGGAKMKGKILGYKDSVREIERKIGDSDKTETVQEKAIVVCNFGYKNFFSPLSGFASFHGTVLDRDYYVARKGEGTATDYNFIHLDPIKIEIDGEQVPFDVRDERVLARYGFESHAAVEKHLQEVVTANASDEHYARWFNPDATPSATADGVPGTQPDDDEPGEDELKALRDRVQGYDGGDAPKDGETKAAPAEEPKQPEAPVAASSGGGMRSFD